MESPSESAPLDDTSGLAPQALLEIAPNGEVSWAAAEALAWWGTTPGTPLVGRALTSLFAETASEPASGAWTALVARAQGHTIRLTALTNPPFEATVEIAAKGEPDARGEDSYIVSVERTASAPKIAGTEAATPAAAGTAPAASETPPSMTRATRGHEEAPVLPSIGDLPDIALDPDLDLDVGDDEPGEDPLAALIDEPDTTAEPIEADDESDALPEPDLAAPESIVLPQRHRLKPSAVDPVDSTEQDAGPLETTFAEAPIGFFHIDLGAGTARFSDGWKRLLGYEPDDVADEPETFASLIHPDDSEASPLALRREGPFSAEIRLQTKDNGWRWMQIEGVCSPGLDTQPARIDGLMLDLQERHEVDEQTALNEARFLRLTGRGTSGFFEIDFDTDSAWFSPEFHRSLGYKSGELKASSEGFRQVLPPDDAEVGVAPFFQSITGGLPALLVRYQLVRADGKPAEFDGFLVARRNRRGVLEHISGLQAPAGDTLRPAETPLESRSSPSTGSGGLANAVQAALDAATEAIVLIDPKGRILHTNTRAATLAGEAPDRLVTRSIHEVYTLVDRATGSPAPHAIDRVLAGAQPLELDQSFALLGQDGPEVVALSCRPIIDSHRKVSGATVVLRQSSSLPLSQAEMVKSNRMEALGRLACGIVHDFNNLLTTVVGGVSLALDKRDLAPLETALKACTNAKNLARQLLTFARGDVTGRRVQSLNEIIRETARMAGAGSKTTVELELSADLSPVNVVTSQLVQVFTNLILNAMQVMPTGGRIWVRTFNMPLGQVNSVNLPAGDYVRVDVQDNGPGIPPENLSHIFEPFFTTRAEGTGLGLAMVNSIVAQHEGAIEASSTVGSGTTFTLYFPRAQTEVVHEAPQKISLSYGTGRILVMDDDADLCTIASGMLDMLGYKADTALNADEAITKFRKSRELNNPYAAVILDLTMAGGPGGEDVVGSLRAIDPEVKAIVSSGYATEENAEHYHKLGFTGILAKPYRSGDLGRVLKEVVGLPK